MNQTPKTTSRLTRTTAKLSSWLRASGIDHEAIRVDTLVVKNKEGQGVQVVVTEGAPAPQGALGVDLESFWSRDMGVARTEFHRLTQALGYGSPEPVPVRKRPEELTHHDYWMRHTEVAVSPNPDPKVFAWYRSIIDIRVRRFVYNLDNRRLLRQISMDEDDVRNLARMWVVSYECLHRPVISTDHDNEKLLHSYLEQRFAELHGRVVAMARDEGFQLLPEDLKQGDPLNHISPSQNVEGREFYQDPHTFEAEESSLDVLEDADGTRERRKMANGLLRTALKKMPKSVAIAKLEDLATRPGVESDVATKAAEHLRRMTRTRKKNRSNQAAT